MQIMQVSRVRGLAVASCSRRARCRHPCPASRGRSRRWACRSSGSWPWPRSRSWSTSGTTFPTRRRRAPDRTTGASGSRWHGSGATRSTGMAATSRSCISQSSDPG